MDITPELLLVGDGRSHGLSFLGAHGDSVANDRSHRPELQRIETGHEAIKLSIFEDSAPPRFRLTGPIANAITLETRRGICRSSPWDREP